MGRTTVADLEGRIEGIESGMSAILAAVQGQPAQGQEPAQEKVAAAAAPPQPVGTDGQVWIHEMVTNVQTGETAQGKRKGYVTRKGSRLVFIPVNADGAYSLSEKNQHGIKGARTLDLQTLVLAQDGQLSKLIGAAQSELAS